MSLTTRLRRTRTTDVADEARPSARPAGPAGEDDPGRDGCSLIKDVRWREPVRVVGRVRSLRVQPRANVPTLECTLVDESGGITVVFLGRRSVPGVRLGTRMQVEGRAGSHHGKLAVLNPDYTLRAQT